MTSGRILRPKKNMANMLNNKHDRRETELSGDDVAAAAAAASLSVCGRCIMDMRCNELKVCLSYKGVGNEQQVLQLNGMSAICTDDPSVRYCKQKMTE